MAKYTRLHPKDIHILAGKYELAVSDHSEIEGGAANSSFLLSTNQEKYVMTIVDNKPTEHVFHHAKLLEHLAKYDFPTCRVITAKSGKKVTIFKDKAIMVKKFIPGTTIRNISKVGLEALGINLARLHKIPPPDFLPQEHSYGVNHFPSAVGVNWDTKFEDELLQFAEKLKRRTPDDLPRGLIHSDVFWDNILFHENEFQALIDFEDACHYYKVYDLASALFGSCTVMGRLSLDNASQIIQGYEKVRILQENERKALQLFTVYAAVAISFWRYMNYNVHNPLKDKRNHHQTSLNSAEDILAIPEGRFNQIFA